MTRLFAQVILVLDFLCGHGPATIARSAQVSHPAATTERVQYVPIPPEGNMMVPTGLFPSKQVQRDGMATHPIYLGNDTDSGISSISHSTLVKTPVKTPGSQRQPFASTPKTKPKLLVMVQQQWNELVAMRQGAPHGAHVWPFLHQASRTRPLGLELFDWKPATNPGASGDSSFVSIEEHIQYTMTALMQRDAPSRIDPDEDMVSVHDDSQYDIKMVSTHEEPDHHTEDSSPDSGTEDSNNLSDDSDMESDQDQGFSHHLDSGSDHCSNPSSDPGSDASLGSDSGADPNSSDEDGGDCTDMFQEKRKNPGSSKKPESWPQSSSHSRSRETENQK